MLKPVRFKHFDYLFFRSVRSVSVLVFIIKQPDVGIVAAF